ncbi:RES domain-containing protein [Flavobacterium limicola]|uniref:RES domain-containing protein n=1 Tax=Flavobacterium limicola TaxID=180441 RepID=A0A495S6W2_9FLAO|nr:RES family NAD+ phosphorylase [Flavobacterium limicola]RKS95593.1 RES domain-containing protein [Flavobacterium limicola]
MNSNNNDEKYICYDCVGENYLKSIIENNGFVINCSYCDNDELECFSLLDFADKIDIAFDQHYIQSPPNPPDDWSIYRLKNLDFWEPDGSPVIEAIMDSANIEEEIAKDVQEILEDKYYDRSSAEIGEMSKFDDESFYDIKSPEDIEWQKQWSNFEHILKTSARFFNKNNEELLRSVFEEIESLHTHEGKPVVRNIGTEKDVTHLYRARAFQSDFKLKNALQSPDKELGPPPSEFATAGRMNSRGISVFYGATDANTALAEIRPPVGCKVALARFELMKTLKVLDLSALTSTLVIGSIFDETYADRLSRIMFLRNLSQRMTRPVMPDDEHSEYLTTQVVADFLSSELELDGIIFPSAQSHRGLNVTLFHSASRVFVLEYPDGTDIIADLTEWNDEGIVPNYTVSTCVPNENIKDKILKNEYFEFPDGEWKKSDPDTRKITLSIDLDSIKVKHVESVQIKGQEFDVMRF